MAEKVVRSSSPFGNDERFMRFIEDWQFPKGVYKYEQMIQSMALECGASLFIDWHDLYEYDEGLAEDLLNGYDKIQKGFNFVLYDKARQKNPGYYEKNSHVHVRFRALPVDTVLRTIGSDHLGKFIQVKGVVVRATGKTPIIIESYYKCPMCNEYTVIRQESIELITPNGCDHCDNKKKLLLDPDKSTFMNYQKITIQERPEELPPGQMPRSLNIDYYDDLVDTVRPGDRVNVVGTPKALQRKSRITGATRVFDIYLEGNNVENERIEEALQITEPERKQLIELSQDPWIFKRLLASIAPSIYGHESEKESILYLLFSGVRKNLPDVTIRGDINVLLIGDPGTGKSQLLQFATKMAPRGIFTTGRGSSAAGLTAAVVRDTSGNYVLEAGALVLADLGVCCIDELDKMKEEDRGAIHPAMEQQVVPIAKGGIVASLNARTSILASANPTLGRYNPYQNVSQNIDLPITILSCFDLIWVLRDTPDEAKDRNLAKHVMNLHMGKGDGVLNFIEVPMLRKYIAYGKLLKPQISEEASMKFENFYVSMRTSSSEAGEAAAISITARQLEGLIRLAEARAKAHLRTEVTIEDAVSVIALMQKSLEQVGIDATTGKVDIDILYTGKPRSLQVQLQKVLSILAKLEIQSPGKGVAEDDLLTILEEKEKVMRPEAAKLISTLMRDGTIFSPRPGTYRRAH